MIIKIKADAYNIGGPQKISYKIGALTIKKLDNSGAVFNSVGRNEKSD
ncbi:MAG: hypothetical protein LBI30_03350 [Holosporales bacterium]|nr:hypothetical protein [Holosporales bacterium]